MDGYVEQALKELEHSAPSCTAFHAPLWCAQQCFGEKIQFATVNTSPALQKDKVNFIQRVVRKLLYYARAVDPTMLHSLNNISISVAKGT